MILKTVLLFPQAKTEENFYLGNLTKTISDKFRVVGMDQVLRGHLGAFFAAKICHLNWLENIRGNNGLRCLLNFIFRLGFLCCLKIFQKKIVWTVHNKVAHDQKRGRKYSKILMKILMRWSDRIHILCSETIDEIPELKRFREKIFCIPHGDYFQNFGDGKIDIRVKYGISQKTKIIFSTGKIGPYKNLELLIDGFKKAKLSQSDFVLLICGKCNDENYRKEIQKKIGACQSIITDFRFIENDCMGDYLEQSDVLATPYDIDSALNSGTLWMAFSYKTPMLCPEIGCIRGNQNIKDCSFVYRYDSLESHFPALCNTLESLKKETRESLAKKGNLAYSEMQQRSWSAHRKEWISLYD